MTLKVVDKIRLWLGWCPEQGTLAKSISSDVSQSANKTRIARGSLDLIKIVGLLVSIYIVFTVTFTVSYTFSDKLISVLFPPDEIKLAATNPAGYLHLKTKIVNVISVLATLLYLTIALVILFFSEIKKRR